MSLKPIALIVLFTATASPLFADENLCETKGSNGMVALVLCPPGLDQSAWKDAGVAACDTRAPCGAWIWEDASAMPETAPERHDQLMPEEVRAAKAIWVNEKSELMVLEQN